jgi:hypothetical protein
MISRGHYIASGLFPGEPCGRSDARISSSRRINRSGQSIEMLRKAVEGSDLKVHKELLPHLPRVLWLYLMGIIFFWIHDRSPGQRRTRRVVDTSLGLLGVLLPLTRTRLPSVRKTVRLLAELLGDLEFWEGEAAAQS